MSAKSLKKSTASLDHEMRLHKQGYELVAGVDEVGRGCLAGPVAACAVIMPKGVSIPGVNDSKKLSSAERERLARTIKQLAIAYEVAYVEPEEIDEYGIQAATNTAMIKALDRLGSNGLYPDFTLIDGRPVKMNFSRETRVEFLIRGDSKSHSIAAASIVAKVERDELMKELAQVYPRYGFGRHKGYGTATHIAAIHKYGVSPIHRRTFLSNI